MTITTSTDPAPPDKKQLTPQQRQAIAITGLALCLIIGGGIVYWLLWGGAPKKRTVTVNPSAPVPGNIRYQQAVQRQRDPRGITRDGGDWIVRGMTGEMRVTADAGTLDNDSAMRFRYPDGLKLPPEQVALLSARFRALRDDAMAKEWGITPEQRTKLEAMKIGGGGMTPSSTDRFALRELWNAYQKAGAGGKDEAQKKLIEKLDEVAKANFDVSRKAFGERLDAMKQILTPQQVEKMTKG